MICGVELFRMNHGVFDTILRILDRKTYILFTWVFSHLPFIGAVYEINGRSTCLHNNNEHFWPGDVFFDLVKG